MKKKLIIFLIIIVVIGLALFFILKSNNKSLINKEKNINGVIFKNVKINKTKKGYTFKVTIKTKEDKTDIESFDAIVTNKKGKELDILSGYVGGISKGETKIITIDTDKDLSEAYEINYTVYK